MLLPDAVAPIVFIESIMPVAIVGPLTSSQLKNPVNTAEANKLAIEVAYVGFA